MLTSDRARPAVSTDWPFQSGAATRQAPSASPLPAPAQGPKATPAASTPTSGQTDPSDCDVEKAWPRPKTQPSNSSSAAPSPSSPATATGEHRNDGRHRQADAQPAVRARAAATRATATTGCSRFSRERRSTTAIQHHATHRKAASAWRTARSTL